MRPIFQNVYLSYIYQNYLAYSCIIFWYLIDVILQDKFVPAQQYGTKTIYSVTLFYEERIYFKR